MSIEQIKNSSNIKRTTVTIDADFKTSGTDSNFVYDLSTTISNVRLVEITNMEFNLDSYNVNDYQNNMTWVDTLGVTQTTTILKNNYSVNFLVRSLQDSMNELTTDPSNKHTVRFDAIDRIQFATLRGVSSFDLNFGTSTDTNMANMLGFTSANLTGTTQYTSDMPIDLVYSKNMFIGSTNLSSGAFDTSEISNGSTNVIAKVGLDLDYGSVVFNKEVTSFRNKIKSLSSIDIRLTDDEGRDFSFEKGRFKITFDIYSRILDNGYSI